MVNTGTAFHIYFPALARSAALTASAPLDEVKGGSETVLVVEDEESVRELMRSVLERFGYRVYCASSGIEALEIWDRHRTAVNMLATDMIMPNGIGGRDLAERLLHDNPHLKVLFCSGYTDDLLGADSQWHARGNFLNKPFDLRDFLRKVRECLDKP